MKLVNVLNMACRGRKRPITVIVLHATAGNKAEGSITHLRNVGLSYHGLIGDPSGNDDGVLYKGVPDKKVAYHAGKSLGPDGSNVNDYSLGLSFACLDNGIDKITKVQWATAVEHCANWIEAYGSVKWITTHAIISPGRKSDPKGPIEGKQWQGRFPLDEFVVDVNRELARRGNRRAVDAWRPR